MLEATEWNFLSTTVAIQRPHIKAENDVTMYTIRIHMRLSIAMGTQLLTDVFGLLCSWLHHGDGDEVNTIAKQLVTIEIWMTRYVARQLVMNDLTLQNCRASSSHTHHAMSS